MICEKCKERMNWFIDGCIQGWICPLCGWDIVTTYIEDMYIDETEYSLYIKKVSEISIEKIKLVSQISGVNFIVARQMLEKEDNCILKAKAPKIKEAIVKLQELNIEYFVNPVFNYVST